MPGPRAAAHRHQSTSWSAAAVLLCLLLLAGVPGAAPARRHPTHHLSTLAPRSQSSAYQTWGGYAMTGARAYTSISGSWNIPALNCARGDGDASPWIGIDGWSNNTVEQIGVDLVCSAGAAHYYPWVEMYPAPSVYFNEPIKAGDTLNASVKVSRASWVLTESDPASGWTQTFRRLSLDQLASAEAIVEDIGTPFVPHLNDFKTVRFSNLVVNGKPFAAAGTANKTTIERGTTLMTSESALSAMGFSITWLHR